MLLSRFSATGFQPLFQSHLFECIRFHLETPLEEYPLHLRFHVDQGRKEYCSQWDQKCHGFWAFIGPAKDLCPQEVSFQLNHLSQRQKQLFKWFEQSFEDNLLAFRADRALKGQPQPLKDFSPGQAVYVFSQDSIV